VAKFLCNIVKEEGEKMGTRLPITAIDKIPVVKIDLEAKVEKFYELREGKAYRLEGGLFDPLATCCIEDFGPGETFGPWSFWHDELQWITKGKAEITYTLPPWHDEEKHMTCEAGDVYAIPCGARLTFKVVSKEPYRHFSVIMPQEDLYRQVQPKKVVYLKQQPY
jgi:mannose-6-phosphate isomerase-like protein (cupin superfamily)